MRRVALLALVVALGAGAWLWWRRMSNMAAFLALIRQAESNNDYTVIAGGDHFDDFSEHPFVLNPSRSRPLNTTASGAYQMVRGTWILARDALGLTDFSPASQDAAAAWLIAHKVPGQNRVKPEGTGADELIAEGKFDQAIAVLGPEWESFAKMARGAYFMTLAQARQFLGAVDA